MNQNWLLACNAFPHRKAFPWYPIFIRLCSVFLICVVFTSMAWSDPAPIFFRGINGETIVPTSSTQIRMIREDVNIDCFWTKYKVIADFWFQNTAAQKVEVQFGFPIEFQYYDRAIEVVLKKTDAYFTAEWNGKPIKTTVGGIQRDNHIQRLWINWTAQFAPAEKVFHRIRYTFPMDHWVPEHYEDRMDPERPMAGLIYVLRTGAAWEGQIDSVIVNINYSHELPTSSYGYGESFSPYTGPDWLPRPSDLKISPKGYAWNRKARTIRWEFKNYEPDQDIQFSWRPEFRQKTGTLHFIFEVSALVTIAALAIAVLRWMFSKRRKMKNTNI